MGGESVGNCCTGLSSLRLALMSVGLEWRVGGGGKGSGDRTPGPTPAMMAIGWPDMVLKWERTERRGVVGA